MYLLALLSLFTDQNVRFHYPFIYLKPEKGTPSGHSFPVAAIIGTIPSLPPRGFPSLLQKNAKKLHLNT